MIPVSVERSEMCFAACQRPVLQPVLVAKHAIYCMLAGPRALVGTPAPNGSIEMESKEAVPPNAVSLACSVLSREGWPAFFWYASRNVLCSSVS